MLKKQIAFLLVCTVTLLSVAPPDTFAQSLAPPNYASSERDLSEVKVKSKTDMKTSIAEETAKIKAESLTTDFKRLERQQQNPQPSPKPKGAFSKGDKILLFAFIVGTSAVVTLLLIKGINPRPLCEEVPNDPSC